MDSAKVTASLASSSDAMAAFIKTSFGDPKQEIRREDWAAPMTAQDIVLGRFAFNALLALTDNSHFQYQEGFLPEEHWLGVRSTIGGAIAASSYLRDHVEATLGQRRPAFRDALIDIMREIDEDSTPGRIRD